MKHPNFKNAQTHYEFILGPIKIKDGLFMGDQLAAKDIQFIISNKVTHVINTVSKVIPNLWQRFGIQYLSVNWNQKQQNIFDKKNNAINAIFNFVQQAMQQGQSCLIHSIHGKSRACAVMVSYLMRKYHWSLDKCFQYITSKKDHLQIRDNYLSQMQQLQKRMSQIYNLTSGWNESKNDDQLILKNTYYNSKLIQFSGKEELKNQKKKVTWGQKNLIMTKPTTAVQPTMTSTMTRFKQSTSTKKTQKTKVKSILKGQANSEGEDNDYVEAQQKMISTDTFPSQKKDNNFMGAINGNIVHVTVNNFINTDKKSVLVDNKSHLVRPYSSDNKQRPQLMRPAAKIMEHKKNLFTYDSGFKSPYDTKLASKFGSSNPKIPKKKEEVRVPVVTYERPQSANIAAQRRKMANTLNNMPSKIGQIVDKSQEMSVIGKKRYPSTNPRDELYKWK